MLCSLQLICLMKPAACAQDRIAPAEWLGSPSQPLPFLHAQYKSHYQPHRQYKLRYRRWSLSARDTTHTHNHKAGNYARHTTSHLFRPTAASEVTSRGRILR